MSMHGTFMVMKRWAKAMLAIRVFVELRMWVYCKLPEYHRSSRLDENNFRKSYQSREFERASCIGDKAISEYSEYQSIFTNSR